MVLLERHDPAGGCSDPAAQSLGCRLAWGDPALRVLVLWLTMLGAMAATREHHHIHIDLLSRFLAAPLAAPHPGPHRSVRRLVCGLLTWHSGRFVWFEWQDGSLLFGALPAWLCELAMPLGFGVMSLRFLLRSPAADYRRSPEMALLGLVLILLALLGAPLFAVIAASAMLGFPPGRDRPVGGGDRVLSHRRDADPAGHPPVYLCRLPAQREPGAPTAGAADPGPAGLAARWTGDRRAGGLRPVHRLYRRLRSDHRGPRRAALSGPHPGRIPGQFQPGSGHHLRQPGAVVRPGPAPHPVCGDRATAWVLPATLRWTPCFWRVSCPAC